MLLRKAPRRELVPYIILVAALGVTAVWAWYAYVSAQRHDRLAFEATAEELRAAVESRLDAYVAMLLGGAGLFAASDEVDFDEFRRYVDRLGVRERYPGIQGIGYSRLVQPHERAGVLDDIRKHVTDFEFWPEEAEDGTVMATVYLEPLDSRNRIALGYDMSSEPTRREAMERARDGGVPAATGVVKLVQEQADPARAQAGFLMYVPVYADGQVPASLEERRNALEGFVFSPFRADDLLKGIIPREVARVAMLEIFDGEPDEGRLLHRRTWPGQADRFTFERPIRIAGRVWTLVVRGGMHPQDAGAGSPAALILIGGLLLSTLLFAVTRAQVVARLTAERLAEERRLSEEKLRASDRAKDEFLATVSHELRTPLNAIVGWASILRTRTVPPEMLARAIGAISRNAAAQTRLVEDLLDMSRAVTGHLSLRVAEVDVRATLQTAIDALQPLAMEARVTLRAELGDSLGTIRADAGRLQQIVTNLLSNSIKFTRSGGQITVRAERTGAELVFSVHDTGIGIDPAFMPFLFDRFRQADSSSTRAHGGTGLGLAIAQHLVLLHGGTVKAESPGPGQGATFIVRLPLAGPAPGGGGGRRTGRPLS